MAEDLNQFSEWFGRILAGLEPAQMRRGSLKLGQALRLANVKRIAENVEPDGRPMEPRKPRKDRRGRLRRRQTGKMFKGLRRLRNWKIDADEGGVEIRPASGNVDRVASVSQFGETTTIGYRPNHSPIRARYPIRRLLGFAPSDERIVMEVAESLIEPGK
ncbi:phage virion morphogenesis protein [Novosphingobium sp. ST904]|uniref:phage virion morphogenesis protein n=1 Tax=Novosphingobium sp. ST904 TaxID=1684385 RepID=UPI0006C8558F|nr:phage virion morphogenesis protein [Novosphingobium sp. ST904]TCM43321.1 phage virion morphogenesis protein [Novosphingobium sp. ST904]